MFEKVDHHHQFNPCCQNQKDPSAFEHLHSRNAAGFNTYSRAQEEADEVISVILALDTDKCETIGFWLIILPVFFSCL